MPEDTYKIEIENSGDYAQRRSFKMTFEMTLVQYLAFCKIVADFSVTKGNV